VEVCDFYYIFVPLQICTYQTSQIWAADYDDCRYNYDELVTKHVSTQHDRCSYWCVMCFRPTIHSFLSHRSWRATLLCYLFAHTSRVQQWKQVQLLAYNYGPMAIIFLQCWRMGIGVKYFCPVHLFV